MLSTFAQASRTPDLHRKLLSTLFIMAMFRLGSYIPTPGANSKTIQSRLSQESETNLFDLVNLFSGGALLQLSVFALSIMSYITTSIIVQLLRVVILQFDDLHHERQTGQAKLTQYTRYLIIFLGILQATTTLALARTGRMFSGCSEEVIAEGSWWMFLIIMIVMMAGTAVVMWLGELITKRGISNGMSLLIFTSIIARLPSQMLAIGQSDKWDSVLVILLLLLAVTLVMVYVEQAQCRIPIQYMKRMIGRRQYGGTTTYIPLKINILGIIPVILASSILALPAMAAQFGEPTGAWVQRISTHLHQGDWIYLSIYSLFILFFAFFYTSTTFNPEEVTDDMERYGGFIPGYHAGRPTAEFFSYVINRITTADSFYLVAIALLPSLPIIPLKLSTSQMPFDGTTLLIIMRIGLQTVKKINTQLQQHHYKRFLR